MAIFNARVAKSRFIRLLTAQQIWRDVELVITVGRGLMFARSDHKYTVLAHQTANSAVTDIKANLFELLSHAWPTIAAKTEARHMPPIENADWCSSMNLNLTAFGSRRTLSFS
jgi:hypothetical protein